MKSEEKKFNDKWSLHKTVQAAVDSSHPRSSPETRERLAILETNQSNIMDKLIEFQEINEKQHIELTANLNEFHILNTKAFEDLNDKIDEALKGKADIWVQKLLIGIGLAIGMGLLSYLGILIIKLIEL